MSQSAATARNDLRVGLLRIAEHNLCLGEFSILDRAYQCCLSLGLEKVTFEFSHIKEPVVVCVSISGHHDFGVRIG